MITDLASNSGRSNPHPALGRIIDFIDPEHRSQAVVKYHAGTVDRPVSRLVRVVKADENISKKGKSICPYAIADEEIQEAWNDEEDTNLPAPEEDAADHQDDDQREELPDRVQGGQDGVPRHLPAGLRLRPQDPTRHQVAEQPGQGREGDIRPQPQELETPAAQNPKQDF